jgi:hypothetical protein
MAKGMATAITVIAGESLLLSPRQIIGTKFLI